MEFGLFVLVGFLMLVGGLMAIGRWYPGTGAEQLDWRPRRSHEDEVRLELEDIDQMLELQNERRRRTGRPELTEDAIRAEVEAEERARSARAAAYREAAAEAPSSDAPPADPGPPESGHGERGAGNPASSKPRRVEPGPAGLGPHEPREPESG